MPADPLAIRVEGLAESVRGLKRLDAGLARAAMAAIREFAKELRDEAVAAGTALGGVHRHAVKLSGVGYFAQTRAAGVKLIGAKSPAIYGAEFGSKQFAQFPAWRGNQFTDPTVGSVGYFLHPTMREVVPEFEPRIADAIVDAIAAEIGAKST